MEKERDISHKLSKELSQIYGENKVLVDKLRENFDYLRKKELNDNDILNLINKKIISVPLSIFKNKLAPLEALVFYLKKNYRFSEIASLLNRDNGTIWFTHNNAVKKKVMISEVSDVFIPLDIFSNRKLSVLENLAKYLRENGFSFKEISEMTGKDSRTIWTVYNRAKKKEK